MAILEIKYYEMFKEIDYPCMSMDKIEWLLLKYNDERGRLEGFLELIEPDFLEVYDDKLFVDILWEFDELSEFHRFEGYCKEQVLEYENKSHIERSLQKDWIIKNENIAVFELMPFEYMYLEQDRNKKYFELKYRHYDLLNINIDKSEFKFITRFLEIFEKLYWKEQILPENLKKIEIDFGIRKTLHPKAWFYPKHGITLAGITTKVKLINPRSCWPTIKRVIKNRESNGPSEYLS
jgi:hypothetical protein